MILKGVQERWTRFRERAAERKRVKELTANDPHLHSRFWLLNIPATATLCAAVVEVYWAILFCIEATGHVDWNYETAFGSEAQTQALWNFAFSAHWPVLAGLVLATAPIVMLSMIWLPVQFAMRGAGAWRRGTIILVGLLSNVLVIVSGTVVMNYNRQEQVREAVVVEQSAEAQRAMLVANVDDLRDELDTLMNHRSTYVATAASVGATAYERDYVAQARATRDPRLPLLERALGSARRADELRAEIRTARGAVAQAAPAAASQANVQDNVGRELNTFAQYVEVWRPPFVAFICTLIGIFGAWWTLAMLERLNPKDVLRSGWADDSHRIEDLREEEPIAAQPFQKQTVLREENPETGEVKIKVTPKPHWRTLKKGQKQKVEIAPDFPADEVGVPHDGGGRSGSVQINDVGLPVGVGAVGAVGDNPEAAQEHAGDDANEHEQGGARDPVIRIRDDEHDGAVKQDSANNEERREEGSAPVDHPEPLFELSEDEAKSFEQDELAPAAANVASEPVQDEPEQEPAAEPERDGEGEQQVDHHDLQTEPAAREPETDPRRLIAAE